MIEYYEEIVKCMTLRLRNSPVNFIKKYQLKKEKWGDKAILTDEKITVVVFIDHAHPKLYANENSSL